MNYTETIQYLYNIPMFEKQGKQGYKEGLENSIALDERFGHPHQKFKSIHVAGTNGKGSVSHTLAAILQSSGYKVGLYTSPHILSFRERIKINGEEISEDYVTRFVNDNKEFFDKISPSFFEIVTAMAFKYFADNGVQLAIIEVGLGGRLDCTNIITPILSVITNIGYDHTQFLGDTLEKIATEKAGIIKPGVPVVVGESLPETKSVFINKAKEMGAPITFADDEVEVMSSIPSDEGGRIYITKDYGAIEGQLGGIYQEKNVNTILSAALPLSMMCYLNPDKKRVINEKQLVNIKNGFKNVCSLTGLHGRWEKLNEHPTVICDTGHNLDGWKYLSKQLNSQKCNDMRIIFGMVDDKDVDSVMDLLPKNATYYFTQADNHRAISAEDIKMRGIARGLNGESYDSVEEAYNQAMKEAQDDDIIFVGGSTYIVSDLFKALKGQE